jgi:hypothetical protein
MEKVSKVVLFLKKKNQKDFMTLGHGRWRRHSPRPRVAKVFCFFFSKKKRFL